MPAAATAAAHAHPAHPAPSSANPWLDFLPAAAAHTLAGELNRDLEDYCAAGPAHAAAPGLQRLYGFGLLPLVPGAAPDALVTDTS